MSDSQAKNILINGYASGGNYMSSIIYSFFESLDFDTIPFRLYIYKILPIMFSYINITEKNKNYVNLLKTI